MKDAERPLDMIDASSQRDTSGLIRKTGPAGSGSPSEGDIIDDRINQAKNRYRKIRKVSLVRCLDAW